MTYKLTAKNELFINYTATTDKKPPVNLTNHAYWNLNGAEKGSVKNHLLTLNCGLFLPVTDSLIPTGELYPVKGTPLDFTKEKSVGKDIQFMEDGYDHCFVINDPPPGG